MLKLFASFGQEGTPVTTSGDAATACVHFMLTFAIVIYPQCPQLLAATSFCHHYSSLIVSFCHHELPPLSAVIFGQHLHAAASNVIHSNLPTVATAASHHLKRLPAGTSSHNHQHLLLQSTNNTQQPVPIKSSHLSLQATLIH